MFAALPGGRGRASASPRGAGGLSPGSVLCRLAFAVGMADSWFVGLLHGGHNTDDREGDRFP